MATNISTLSVKLVANISGFASGMANAAKPLAGFASKVGSAATKITALAGAGTALIAGGSLTMLTKNSMEAIDASAKLADRLGYTTEQLVGLQHGANLSGVAADTLTGGLEKMLNALADAATKGGPVAASLRQLGLDAQELANGSPDAAFKAIADALVGVENPAQRAQLAMDIFGKSGQQLLPLMMSGAEGIAAAQEEAKKLGLTFSRVDAAKVELANDAVTRLSSAFTGVANTLAIELAPLIQYAAEKLTGLATSGEGVGARVLNVFEWILRAVARTADFLALIKAAFKELQAGAAYLGAAFMWAMNKATDAVAGAINGVIWLINKAIRASNELLGTNWEEIEMRAVNNGVFEEHRKGLLDEARKLHGEAKDAFNVWDTGANATAVTKFFDDVRAKSQTAAESIAANAPKMGAALREVDDNADGIKKVSEALADLDKQIRQAGMTDSQKRLDDLAALGAQPEQLAETQAKLNRLDELDAARKKQEDMQERARSVVESVMTPMEKFTAREQELSDLLNAGLLTWDQYGRAIGEARKELEAASEVPAADSPDLIKAGSAAAQRFAYDFSRGQQKLNPTDIPKKQFAEAQEQTKLLAEVAKNTRSAPASEQKVVAF